MVQSRGSNWQGIVGDLGKFCHKHLFHLVLDDLINSFLKKYLKGQEAIITKKRTEQRTKKRRESRAQRRAH